MPYLIGSIIGALIATYLVSSLFMWLTKRMGDTASRLVTAFALGFVATFVLSGFGSADGGPFNPWKNLPFYGPALIFWFGVQWLGFQKRSAQVASQKRRLEL